MVAIRLAARPWDHVLPLGLGDVAVEGLSLEVLRRESTPNPWTETDLDAAETSFSGYLHRWASGERSWTALPVFVMQGFRHRCVITRADGPASLAELRGTTVGLTGWPDSGNVWTRALFRAAGVELGELQWRVGPLTRRHPVTDRIGPRGAPANVRHTDHDGALIDQLRDGTLSAVLTPFVPPGFSRPGSGLRWLLPDLARAEADYYAAAGYVPGIHVLVVRSALLERHPHLAQALVSAFQTSADLAFARHAKLADVTPWLALEISRTERVFGGSWLRYGWQANEKMAADFLAEQHAQQLTDTRLSAGELFPVQVEPA